MSALNIVVPMAGRGSRFADAGFKDPKPLIPVGGRPMIEWVVENIRPTSSHRFIFLCLKEHLDIYPSLVNKLSKICPGCEIIPVSHVTEGAACTVLLARDFIDNNDPLMIANSDQIVELPIDNYLDCMETQNADGLIMTFWSDHPKWSYCGMREDGTVGRVVEKEVISNEATVGIYNFRHGSRFVQAADNMIRKNLRVNNEFYVAPCYNELIADGARVVVARTGKEYNGMHGLGIPSDLEAFTKTDYFRLHSLNPTF
jgi:dTDP-glucose pyrophosphorylase